MTNPDDVCVWRFSEHMGIVVAAPDCDKQQMEMWPEYERGDGCPYCHKPIHTNEQESGDG